MAETNTNFKAIILQLKIKKINKVTSLVVQWLELQSSNAVGSGFSPRSGNWIPYAVTKDRICHS